MKQRKHHDYYVSRAKAARALALKADCPEIAKIHYVMAAQYDLTAMQIPPPISENDGRDYAV
ncbi:hypothetical protein [Sphingomonas sp. 37zxx]|uniref:hypothetical protein n=1 Tax=Sphingomonas sp. 37zxx TaxID=1550073 RepID=UPI000AE54D9C|nr:hypothetical protein [Sphingomonas sp. 37zxx]